MWPNPQFPADLVTFAEEILNGKLHFLCSDSGWLCINKLRVKGEEFTSQFHEGKWSYWIEFWQTSEDAKTGFLRRFKSCVSIRNWVESVEKFTPNLVWLSTGNLTDLKQNLFILANNYLFRVSKSGRICSNLTKKNTGGTRQWRRSGVFIVNFEHMSHLFPEFLLMALSKYLLAAISPLHRLLINVFISKQRPFQDGYRATILPVYS